MIKNRYTENCEIEVKKVNKTSHLRKDKKVLRARERVQEIGKKRDFELSEREKVSIRKNRVCV